MKTSVEFVLHYIADLTQKGMNYSVLFTGSLFKTRALFVLQDMGMSDLTVKSSLYENNISAGTGDLKLVTSVLICLKEKEA
jgi:hypothetical protein